MIKKAALLMALSGLVTGCVSTPQPPINFSVPDVKQVTTRQAIELKSISVSYGLPNEIKGNIPSYGGGYPMLWEKSLAEAIDKSRVFTDDSDEKVNIFVKVLELDPPLGGGLTMVTPARARYTIVSRRTGKTLFEKEIYTQGNVPPEYAFSGRTRLKESLNRSVQENIYEFIKSLSAVKL